MALNTTIVGILGLVCAVWVIYDVLVNQKKMKTAKKVIWIVCGLLFSIITALVYYFVIKKK